MTDDTGTTGTTGTTEDDDHRPSYDRLLLDHLRAHGPAHGARLARELGLYQGRVSVVLRRLAEVGLLDVDRRPGPRGGRWRLYYRAVPTATWRPRPRLTSGTET